MPPPNIFIGKEPFDLQVIYINKYSHDNLGISGYLFLRI